jgi:5-formyltetrahydrofolate cyclo-ligase
MNNPSQLRKTILSSRNALSATEIEKLSERIQDQLLGMDQIKNSQNIFAYVSFRSEVATMVLIDKLLELGKTVTVPITRVKEKRLDAVQITSRSSALEPGYCNIPEPTQKMCDTNTVAPESIETILLPGSVFDLRGGRFGYGGGYYDRFVSNIAGATRIGLAYDLQIVDRAPIQDHDEILDFIVTESMIIKGSRTKR